MLVVSTLLEDAHRWGKVSLDIEAGYLPIFSSIRGKVPKLYTLRLGIRGWSPFNIAYFDDAPALRHVTIHCRDSRQPSSTFATTWTFALPWSQLETYTEDSSYNLGFYQVLSNSSADLTSVEVTTSRFDPTEIQKFAKHDKLTRLFIENSDPAPAREFFARDLDLPRLTDLHIAYRTSIAAPSLDDVTSLIIRSECSLQRLSLPGLDIQPGALSSLLQHCRDLEDLCIDFIPSVDLNKLILEEGSSEVLVPKLLKLSIHYPVYFIFEESTSNMLDCRLLDQVARSRVDRPWRSDMNGSGSSEGILAQPIISIRFTASTVRHFIFERLENWPRIQSSDSESVRKVTTWAGVISQEASRQKEWLQAPWKRASLWGCRPRKSGGGDDLEKVLKEMEGFNPSEGVNLTLVHVSGLSNTLLLSRVCSFTIFYRGKGCLYPWVH
jgi:hypothetical protein